MSDNASGSIEGKVTREEMSDVFAVVRTEHAELWERFVDSMRASWVPWTARHPARIAVMELKAVFVRLVEPGRLQRPRKLRRQPRRRHRHLGPGVEQAPSNSSLARQIGGNKMGFPG